MTEAELRKMLKEASDTATHRTIILFAAAMQDEVKADDDMICNTAMCAYRYVGYIEKHIVKLKEVEEIIEKKSGLQLKGWGEKPVNPTKGRK